MISILIPSRGRPEELLICVDSLKLSEEMELLVLLDSNDPKLSRYQELFKSNPFIKLFIKDRVGYKRFHEMVDFLISQARYDWFFLFNDDAHIENPDWFAVFKNFVKPFEPTNQPVVINIWGEGAKVNNIFQITSRKFSDILGHFSLAPSCDDYIQRIALSAGINYTLKGLKPKHRKYHRRRNPGDDAVNDETSREVANDWEKFGHIWDPRRNRELRKLMHKDIQKIVNYQTGPELCRNCSLIKTVGFVGLGKLGLLVAEAIAERGYKVIGYDIQPVETALPMEKSIEDLVLKSDIVFCAVQTPHDPLYEGDKPLPSDRADFDYSYLVKAIKDIAAVDKDTTLVVVSTCLPGTFEREIKPLLTKRINYIYNPFFIAMGTVVYDFLNPEFVLIGGDDPTILRHFYIKIHGGRDKTFVTDIITAEGIKVFYNTFITTKTVLGNMYGEFAHKTGMNVDHIYKALSRATDRLISAKYLKSGVGDGGGCHPRDNIALSFLANKIELSFNFFDALMASRQKHTEWFADIFIKEMEKEKIPGIILGKSFKPGVELQTGSAAILLANILKDKNITFQHYEFDYPELTPAVYFIATQHQQYTNINFPLGSVVIDPHRYIKNQQGVKIVRIGVKTD